MLPAESGRLAPFIPRQRLIIEGIVGYHPTAEQVLSYLGRLSEVSDMNIISGPEVNAAHHLGPMGRVYWKTSGATLYSYPFNGWGMHPNDPRSLVTVDTCTCKPFNIDDVVNATYRFFRMQKINHWEP